MSNSYCDIVKIFEEAEVSSIEKFIIVGLSDLGIDICKNLVCNGCKHIYIVDDLKISDSQNNIFKDLKSLDLVRSNYLLKLNELNNDASVISIRGDISEDLIFNSIIIMVNQLFDNLLEFSKTCRNLNSKIIIVNYSGISGFVFVDANNHKMIKKGNENDDLVVISNISSEGIVTCPANYYHHFNSGDKIKFKDLEGDNLDFLNKEWKIEVYNNNGKTNKEYFKLLDFPENIEFCFINGYCYLQTDETIINHKSFEEILNESDEIVNIFKMMEGINFDIWSKDMDDFLESCNELSKNIIRFFNQDFPSIRSLFASVVSMEVNKLIFGIGEPINQLFKFTESNLSINQKPENLSLTKYGSLYGVNFDNKIKALKIIVIGCGSSCTELLKILAEYFSDTCVEILLCDRGRVNEKNIKRNFIFKKSDIGKFKASEIVKKFSKYNSFFDMNYLLDYFDDNEYYNELIKNYNIIINTVNDLDLKNMVGEKCFDNNIPYFTVDYDKLNVTSMCSIPFVTNEFESIKQNYNQISYLLCHKEYPRIWKHCLHYAASKSMFFKRFCKNNNLWVKDKNFYNSLSSNDKFEAINDINMFRNTYKFKDWKDCALFSADYYCDEFINSIQSRLISLPKDKKLDSGKKFWSGGKKCPKIIKFNLNNDLILEFIFVMTRLLSKCLCFNCNFDKNDLIRILRQYKVKELIVKEDEEEQNIKDELNEDIKFNYLKEFKDDVQMFISLYANLRALNYGIDLKGLSESIFYTNKLKIDNDISELDFNNLKTIETISFGVSILCNNLIKYLINSKMNLYNNTKYNFVNNKLKLEKMKDTDVIDLKGNKISKWDKFNYEKNTTLRELMKYYNEESGFGDISFISWGSHCLYGFSEENLDKKLFDIFINKNIDLYKKSEFLELCFDDEEDYDFNNLQEEEEDDKCIRVKISLK